MARISRAPGTNGKGKGYQCTWCTQTFRKMHILRGPYKTHDCAYPRHPSNAGMSGVQSPPSHNSVPPTLYSSSNDSEQHAADFDSTDAVASPPPHQICTTWSISTMVPGKSAECRNHPSIGYQLDSEDESDGILIRQPHFLVKEVNANTGQIF